MKVLKDVLAEMGEFDELKKQLDKAENAVMLTGCMESSKLHAIYGLSEGFSSRLIVTHNELRVREIVEDYKIYDRNVISFPAKDLIFYQADIHGNRIVSDRIKCLRRILENKPVTIVTTFSALMAPQVSPEVLKNNVLRISKKATVSEEAVAKKLVRMGYVKAYQVESPGEFSIRGGIVDIFDLTEENPFRIELWGDEVDSIRSFDPGSQRSIEMLEDITIYPATELLLTDREMAEGVDRIEKEAKKCAEKLRKDMKTEEAHRLTVMAKTLKEQVIEFRNLINLDSYIRYFYEDANTLLDLFDRNKTAIFLDEPARIEEHARAIEAEFGESMINRIEKGYSLPGQADILFPLKKVMAVISHYHTAYITSLDMKNQLTSSLLKPSFKLDITVKGIPGYNNSFESLVKDLKKFKERGYRVLLLSGSRTRAERLATDLRDNELNAFYSDDPDRDIKPREIRTCYGHISRGFEYPMLKFAVISETDIFGAIKKKKPKKKRYDGQQIRDFNELSIGDYVVHETHGLGIYRGIEKIEVDRIIKDYIKIEYRDGGNLYVLATGLDVLQKYASSDAKKPKLNKLGSKEWTATKEKVRAATYEIAQDLVNLYAARQNTKGYCFGPDTVWQKEFEEMFPFEETDDQLAAIEDTKRDMESDRIMDRLICGDVGYGKTEIAIRAAFKAVQEGKQVVFLVPTTILAQQHFNTFVQRMKNFPVRIELLSRFRTASEIKKTVSDLRKGMTDIVIGTHRVLSDDVGFKDLGLLIIDEEQRFGVSHKEKIKKLKQSVDVLTLSATPIPRTLHMSLVGIRDMSVLDEAPADRLPIQTYVMEYNEEMVREAIVRELSRQGQVYYVYNRINNIADVAAMIQQLVPEARVEYAHGQMHEKNLENIMYDFINHDIDVLVSTTIIETGMDISNVNTIIIHDSDKMGLSQLYQLRGRIGRSNRLAYAFLMYRKDYLLKEVAEKRLEAIKEFTDLGSGFKIAMKDLEIRGAGNLLGRSQHGHMSAVGYDLYCKMLNEAVRNLKGEDVSEDFDTTVDLDVDAYIPPEYIVNEAQKLDIYKRIAGIESKEEADDMREELLDRFGTVPESASNLIRISLIRVNAHRLYLTDVKGKEGRLELIIRKDAAIKPEGISDVIMKHKGLSFNPKLLKFIYTYRMSGMVEKDTRTVLSLTEEILDTMVDNLL
ncbi:MAG: transcription-repair coupling factor [Lachnospiraceae bacterium]|nr:transcription-repair coupling factor [Lachnospiraceae bacterium]